MNIVKQEKTELNILCIGQPMSGKSFFLHKITKHKQEAKNKHLFYKIYVTKIRGMPIYFHEVSQKFEVYMEPKYDGVLYFINLFGTRKSIKRMLKWLEDYASCSGQQVYNIPIQIVVAKAYGYSRMHKERKNLQKQLVTAVNPQQILFWETLPQGYRMIKKFCKAIKEQKAQCLKRTFTTEWKMFGFEESIKYFIQKFQQYFIFGNNKAIIYVDDSDSIWGEQSSQAEQDQQSLQSDLQSDQQLKNQQENSQVQQIKTDEKQVIQFNNNGLVRQNQQEQSEEFEVTNNESNWVQSIDSQNKNDFINKNEEQNKENKQSNEIQII